MAYRCEMLVWDSPVASPLAVGVRNCFPRKRFLVVHESNPVFAIQEAVRALVAEGVAEDKITLGSLDACGPTGRSQSLHIDNLLASAFAAD